MPLHSLMYRSNRLTTLHFESMFTVMSTSIGGSVSLTGREVNLVENPFKVIRLQHNLSQYEVARQAKISKHAVLRLEQGMYENPLPTLVNFYVDRFKINRAELIDAYENFQVATRHANKRLLGPIDLVGDVAPVGTHPLVWLRSVVGFNPTELAKRLCISQSAIVYFEKRSIHQHTVPAQLMYALSEAGYSALELEAFEDAYKEYRDYLINKQDITSTTSSTTTEVA